MFRWRPQRISFLGSLSNDVQDFLLFSLCLGCGGEETIEHKPWGYLAKWLKALGLVWGTFFSTRHKENN